MNEKRNFKIPVVWSMAGWYEVMASSKEEAVKMIRDLPLPDNAEYIGDSFYVDEDEILER